jgi:hypothetical protein
MLQELLYVLYWDYSDRMDSGTMYTGWGRYAGAMITKYLDAGGSRVLLKCVASLAYRRACEDY